MTELATLNYPRLFRGVFERTRGTYAPMLEDARQAMAQMSVPGELRPYFDYVVRENPQPSFVLLPLLFLATADASGGITLAHRRCLPILMLSMEAIAVADDTIDRTPFRSGRPTFAARFGERSATPFIAALMTLVAEQSVDVDPRVFEQLSPFFVRVFSDELWESQHLYPAPDTFERWLEMHYSACTSSVWCVLNLSLMLNERAPIPMSACQAFGRVFQDVDDVVNLVENRAADGENDDVTMGMVTFPMLHTVRARPELLASLQSLWETSRALESASLATQRQERDRLQSIVEERYRPLRGAILEIGVPAAVTRVLHSCRDAISASPPALRGVMREMTASFADRLRRCGGLELVTSEQIDRALEDASLSVAAC